MLFYTMEDMPLKECKFCDKPRFQMKGVGRYKEVPIKRMHYLPLIPRLKRLYASMSYAPHMRWHYENRREPGVLCHPSDGEAWKHFDKMYPEFASEPTNVRLALSSDGFSAFYNSTPPYSCWPVIVTPYNLPSKLCMPTPFMFLTLIIPGPHSPKGKIDVYLQPLIDELKQLWTGVLTYDILKKENFIMKAALMWTISDFSAYGMLSGWSTSGRLACPYCMNQSKAFRLKNGRKFSWFDPIVNFCLWTIHLEEIRMHFIKIKLKSLNLHTFCLGMNYGNKFVFFQKSLKSILVYVMNMVSLIIGRNKASFGSCLMGKPI